MPSIQEIQDAIVEEFAIFEDWEEKYEYIIERGLDLTPLSAEEKTEERRILGCQSAVWLKAGYDKEAGVMYYGADSDSMIVKGLISMLIEIFSGQPPEAVANATLSFLERLGLNQHLSSTRSNGLAAMVKQIKIEALRHVPAG
jgi:cysteine desulfuration protein SufE